MRKGARTMSSVLKPVDQMTMEELDEELRTGGFQFNNKDGFGEFQGVVPDSGGPFLDHVCNVCGGVVSWNNGRCETDTNGGGCNLAITDLPAPSFEEERRDPTARERYVVSTIVQARREWVPQGECDVCGVAVMAHEGAVSLPGHDSGLLCVEHWRDLAEELEELAIGKE